MLDMETEVKLLVDTISAAIEWSANFPQDFRTMTAANGLGCWKVKGNGVALRTSSNHEWSSNVTVEIQVWAATVELRAAYKLAIDTVFGALFKRSSSGGDLEEILSAGNTAYRSILNYDAQVRNDYQIIG